MKKQLFALIACALFVSQAAVAEDRHHGLTTYRTDGSFLSGSPMRVSIFNTEAVNQHCLNGNKGGLQVAVYGGKNARKDSAAQYFMPYGHKKYTVQGQQTFKSIRLLSQ